MKEKNALRYLFITRILTGGGAERFVASFASYMADQGYDVHILSYEISEKDYPLSSNVKLHVMPFVADNLPGKFLRMYRMLQALTEIKADVLVPFIDSVVYCTYLVNLLLRKKFIFTVRKSIFDICTVDIEKYVRCKCETEKTTP